MNVLVDKHRKKLELERIRTAPETVAAKKEKEMLRGRRRRADAKLREIAHPRRKTARMRTRNYPNVHALCTAHQTSRTELHL